MQIGSWREQTVRKNWNDAKITEVGEGVQRGREVTEIWLESREGEKG